ncbi:class I SAM-dependent methyltransferase [Marinomonas fungiae]|uniref:Methyltransferase domain n=1 Tax=Marinomonas fungiae TaxID=1137284 RepID=A0A0K6IHF7_9GAMM|nr:class I SAM-dependent methyltransferase [Marinomonas fungiae]CUB02496.1 Methyltransferase domain [Marinomonas fungiae]
MRTFDPSSAANYSRVRPTYPPELYYWLSHQVKQTERVWDCACGTGQASIDLAAYFNQVEATDISEAQIAKATPHRKVNYSVQPSEHTNFPDNYFDAVCVAHALHWFDLDSFWAEVRRVLKPEGKLFIWGYNWVEFDNTLDQAIKEHLLPILQPFWPEKTTLLRGQYTAVEFPFTKIETPTFELKCHWTMSQAFAFMRSWSASQIMMEKHGDFKIKEAEKEIEYVWKDPLEKVPARLPFFLYAGTFDN